MKSEELRHLIWTRFQIHYSTGGAALVKRIRLMNANTTG
jgi:hypothetical protein